MHRAVSSVTVALGLFGLTVAFSGTATAAPAPQPKPEPGKKRCAITDPRLREVSGLVATKSGYIVVNDGTEVEERKRVFYLDTKCQVTKAVAYTQQGPFDTEDLALSPDGKTLWIADTGDNITSRERRERVAVWTMPVDGSKRPVLHRLSYPERKPHDAEALLIGPDNLPLVITKELNGKSQIFTPTGPLRSGDTEPVPMKKVGEVTVPKTTTENPLNSIGRQTVTGAARAPDGSRVVLRTYADAFEFDVADGDVLAALTTGKPRVTPLTDPFGEAISYTPDGKTFVTVSDGGELADDEELEILAYTPATTGAEALAAEGGPPEPKKQSWTADLSLDDITYLIAATGILGALLVGAGIVGIVRARRRPDASSVGPKSDGGPLPGDDERAAPVSAGERPRGGVYGGAASGGHPAPVAARPAGRTGDPAPAGVYGGKAARGGAVYGGGRPAGDGDGGRPGGGAGGGRAGGGRPGGGVYGAAAPPGPGPAAGGRGGRPGGGRPTGGGGQPGGGGGGQSGGNRGDQPGAPRGAQPGAGQPAARGGPAGGAGRGGQPGRAAQPPRGGQPDRGGQSARGGQPPRGGQQGRGGHPPAGDGGRGGVYGGGRAEPPRRGGREPDPRAGRRRDAEHDDGNQSQPPYGGRGDYRGERY
ncbi:MULTISPECIES: hypothetical protein [Micromonospora]|nr:hypothetical protein [Micromonospora yangpuensis]